MTASSAVEEKGDGGLFRWLARKKPQKDPRPLFFRSATWQERRFSACGKTPKMVCAGSAFPAEAGPFHKPVAVAMFDPLHKWLGIPPDEQPPNHYRLLGISLFEHDMDVIDAAADKQLAFLHDLTNGEYAEQAEQLSNQVSAARLCLRNEQKRKVYDETLRGSSTIAARSEPAPGSSNPPPIDAAYDVSAPQRESSVAPPVHAKRKKTDRRNRSPSRLFWQVSSFFCIIALVLIAIGLQQGKLVLNRSLLESIGILGPEPAAPTTIAQGPIDSPTQKATEAPPVEPNPPDPEGTPSISPATRAADASPPADPLVGPQPPPEAARSLADLVHSETSGADAMSIVKAPLPSESQVEEKLALIRDLYQDEYRDAQTSAQKIELAKMMHRIGQETTDDPVGRFALWRVARDIMSQEGEFASALAIVDNLDAHYQNVDGSLLKVQTLRDTSSKVADSQFAAFLDALVAAVAVCRSDERFDLAKTLCEFARQKLDGRVSAAQRSDLQGVEAETKAAEESFLRYQQALAALDQSQENPAANENAGRYLCFVRGEWKSGLPYLALGGDASLRSAAERELASPAEASQWIEVADAWFDVAAERSGSIEQTAIRRHALDWYRKARDDAKGLEQIKVDSRIASLEKLIPAGAAGRGDSELESNNVIGYRMKTSTESRSDFATRRGNQFNVGMGPRPDGRGEAQAGIELQGVEKLRVVGSASHKQMPEIDKFSKAGFVVDYHTPGGYSKRVFLGLGLRPGREFSEAPSWGTAKLPDVTTDIGRAASYEIDLTRWAPSTWDGRCWFTIYMQNAGAGRSLSATLSW